MGNVFDKLDRVSLSDRVLLLTHVDMDAAGAEILSRLTFKDLTVKNLSNNEMSKGILSAVIEEAELGYYDKHDIIIVNDISCNMDDAEEIDKILKETGISLVLLDHHDTALGLNKFKWALVKPDMFKESCIADKYAPEIIEKAHSSGASLMYDYLVINDIMERTPFLDELIHIIAAYDTWDWHDLLGENERYSSMDKLCDIYGLDDFVDEMYSRSLECYTAEEVFNSKDIYKLEKHKKKVDEYLGSIKDSFVESTLTFENDEYNIAWCFTSSYLQETFILMKEMLPNKDLYIIDFGNGVSLRTDNPYMHVGMFASQRYGGGGHPGAAGFGLTQEVKRKCLEIIMGGTINNIEK